MRVKAMKDQGPIRNESGATSVILALVLAAVLTIGMMAYLGESGFSLRLSKVRRVSTASEHVAYTIRKYVGLAASIRYSLPYSPALDACVRGTGCVGAGTPQEFDF